MPKHKRDVLSIATNPDPERARKIEDETLALRLLAGFAQDDHDRPITQYLKNNSRDERLACAALARIVRDHVPGFSGELLALALDPHTASKIPGMKATRRVRFESPARGKPSTWARDLLVVNCIRTELFWSKTGKLEAAIKAAMDRFTISRATAQSIWKRYEKLLGRN
jgi:hypothetical protein